MSIKAAYKAAISAQGHVQDDVQWQAVERLALLQESIERKEPGLTRFLNLIKGNADNKYVKGVYLWGGVGRGKTFLMDLFFTSLNCEKKKRIHFHRMMRDIHERLNAIQDTENPLDQVASNIAAETRVLCFDEFFVSDIGDAMILARLLESLFERGVTLVATSNARPADLYKDGLQRERFIPAITLLEKYTDVIQMDGGTDYRLQLLQEAGTYFTPDDEDARRKLLHYFEGIASGETVVNQTLDILGRQLRTERCAKGVVWFDFHEICDGPRSQDDYIEVARWFPTVIISGIPQLDRQLENPARRFIALVDEFYDRRVKLIVSASESISNIYTGERLKFEFQRTTSRLTEMQSSEYLHDAHLA